MKQRLHHKMLSILLAAWTCR